VNVTDLYSKKYPTAAKVMSQEEFKGLVEVFRTLSEWKREAESGKGDNKWTASSSTECPTGSKKKDSA